MARPVVKWAAEVPDAAEIPSYLERAYAVADSGPQGRRASDHSRGSVRGPSRGAGRSRQATA